MNSSRVKAAYRDVYRTKRELPSRQHGFITYQWKRQTSIVRPATGYADITTDEEKESQDFVVEKKRKIDEVVQSYEVVVGLETHVQLKTKTKAFCDCANISGTKFVESSDDDPANDSSGIGSENANCNVCPICLGHPGTLPILNEEVKMMAIKTGKIGHKRRNLLEDDIQGLS